MGYINKPTSDSTQVNSFKPAPGVPNFTEKKPWEIEVFPSKGKADNVEVPYRRGCNAKGTGSLDVQRRFEKLTNSEWNSNFKLSEKSKTDIDANEDGKLSDKEIIEWNNNRMKSDSIKVQKALDNPIEKSEPKYY